ncbi:MAG: hypothetical protein J7K73_00745 [Nanoarchaeota archaeon]|nr:hypothetical protein [Nanoarchaeota archaeon]
MTTDEELKRIVEGLEASGELENYSHIEQMLRKGDYNTAIEFLPHSIRTYSISERGQMYIHDINIRTTPEKIVDAVKKHFHGLPHAAEELYFINADKKIIFLRDGGNGIGTLVENVGAKLEEGC